MLTLAWLMIFLIPASALAQGELGPDAPLPSVEARRSLAAKLASSFVELDRQIPPLSPSQERWLQTEYKDQIAAAGGKYTERALTATRSLEYQISLVKPRNAEIIGALTQLSSRQPRDKNQEVALWTAISGWFVDAQYWYAVRTLVDSGRVRNKIGHVESLYFENYTLDAQGILNKIVIPHLLGQLP